MSITDELRKFMAGADGYELWCPRHKEELTAIADRIDAEHESAMYNMRREFEEWKHTQDTCYVKLPVDADGEYIHAGDVLDGYGKTIEVVELRHGRSGWLLISRDGNGYDDTFAFTHHHAPTVEDVLREFGDWYAHTKGGCDEDGIIAEFAAKLRLAKEGE